VKTKAAILEELNKPLNVALLEVPNLDVGQVLVKVHASGVCGKQSGEICGWYGPDRFLPHLLGHEGGGVVEEVGLGVSHVKKGDHVVMHWRKSVGIEAKPPKYFDPIGRIEQIAPNTESASGSRYIGAGPIATFTEWAVISENRLTPVPKELPFDIAALLGCAVTTALGLINNEARLKIGQSIAVIGCGGVGLNVIRGARMVGANPIFAVDKLQSKLDMAEVSGATHMGNASSETWDWDNFGRFFGQKGVDVVAECTGVPENITAAIAIAAPRGKVILVGQPRFDQQEMTFRWDQVGQKEVFSSQGGETNPTEDIPRYADLWLAEKLDLNGIITDTFILENINQAFMLMKTGRCGRCMIEF